MAPVGKSQNIISYAGRLVSLEHKPRPQARGPSPEGREAFRKELSESHFFHRTFPLHVSSYGRTTWNKASRVKANSQFSHSSILTHFSPDPLVVKTVATRFFHSCRRLFHFLLQQRYHPFAVCIRSLIAVFNVQNRINNVVLVGGGTAGQCVGRIPCNSTKFGGGSLLSGRFLRNRLHKLISAVADKDVDAILVTEGEEKTPLRSYSWADKKKPRVCILGGGFGGLYTALRLESLVWPDDRKPQVVLIDQSDRFVFKPMLYELLTGEVDAWEIAPRFLELLAKTGIQFFQDKVKALNPMDRRLGMNDGGGPAGTVQLESGVVIEYDWLVLALGAEANVDVVPGAAEFAIPFTTLENAFKVDEELKVLERKNFGKDSPICVAVVGCGYSGVELAATVSERLKSKGIVKAINVDATILPTAPTGNREAALRILSERKVELLLGYFVRGITKKAVDSNDVEKLILELQPADKGLGRQTVEADLVLWTVGSKAPIPEIGQYELPLNGRGQVETDENLRVKGHSRIFAIGDSSTLRDNDGKLLPSTAQVAFQQADFAGWNLWAAINNRPLLPFRFQNLGEMMTLGMSDAAISPSFIDGLTLEGPIGHTARKIAYLLRLPTDEHRLKVGLSWFTKSAVDTVATLQSNLLKVLSGSS
ncbi:alternative NAD(P)H-ubiquinone oxidoreductase C1, chloroplastic/mitochondrial [Impatiens glandulifera]|uniref:alternative NAD(P)H-ubiquinone oxidoreductase C1, chloroplastic/mitochondrial n=1 Tax=Impatiens glandulifera TaxID=253017 RepID=UPI001FB16739|nr:alternative NAD(P)H-ubiquinone oxidoreductase C1, chloroplastic/mitochondrial [Impatiens glandulifera]